MTTATAGPCDRAVAESTAAATTTKAAGADKNRVPAHPAGTLAATILGSSLAFIDGSVVNVGLAAIEHDLGASGATLSWLVNAYLLPLGALVLVGGAAGDRFGRKRVFLAGILVFTLASIACALAPGFAVLLAARAAQGIGAALLMPASLALLGAAFGGAARGRAVGTWAAAGAVFGAVGPLAGGWLIDVAGWRAIFLVNVPVAAAAALLAWRYVDESASAEKTPLDVGGAILATAGLLLLTFGLTALASGAGGADAGSAAASSTTGPLGRSLIPSAAAVAIGLTTLGAFAIVEAKRGSQAMLPLALFSTRGFVGVTLLTLFLYAALGGMFVLVPYLLIESAGYSATAAGAALLPVPVAMGLGSRAAGKLAERTGPRLLLTIGPAIVAVGFALFLRIGPGGVDYAGTLLPAFAVVAIGLTLSVAPLTTAVMSAVDAAHVGSASGVNNAVARIAGLLATALVGFVFAAGANEAGFIARFHAAAIVGSALALAAGAAAFALVAPAK